jgi:hypothetical protein
MRAPIMLVVLVQVMAVGAVGDQVETVGQRRNQGAEHLAAGWQAVKQQDRRRGATASFAVEDLSTLYLRGPVVGSGGHQGGSRGVADASAA